MSAFPCNACKQRKPGKLATAYWAWFTFDGVRVAWKVRYCPACAVEQLSALLSQLQSSESLESPFSCVTCGADASTDSDPIYCTLYVPQREMMELALQLDSACAAKLRVPIVEMGTRLDDRGGVVRGPSPLTSAWDALGLSPS